MYKLVLILIFFIISFSNLNAYNPTEKDGEIINNINNKLYELLESKNEVFYRKILYIVSNNLTKKNLNEKNYFLLEQIKNSLDNIIKENFEHESPIKQLLTKDELRYKLDIFSNYGNNILEDISLDENCLKNYDLIDKIARDRDFPTPLIISFWKMEGGCNLSNPKNGWGPFQITSHYYEPGEINLEQFGEYINYFIDFSKGKINYYNSSKNLQNKFGLEKIDIGYNNYTIEDLIFFSALYNGLNSIEKINSSSFVYGNYNDEYKSNYDGILTIFLKVTKWELKNFGE